MVSGSVSELAIHWAIELAIYYVSDRDKEYTIDYQVD